MAEIETINDSLICSRELKIGSLVHWAAAWIIVMAEDINELPDETEPSTFEEILEAIRKT